MSVSPCAVFEAKRHEQDFHEAHSGPQELARDRGSRIGRILKNTTDWPAGVDAGGLSIYMLLSPGLVLSCRQAFAYLSCARDAVCGLIADASRASACVMSAVGCLLFTVRFCLQHGVVPTWHFMSLDPAKGALPTSTSQTCVCNTTWQCPATSHFSYKPCWRSLFSERPPSSSARLFPWLFSLPADVRCLKLNERWTAVGTWRAYLTSSENCDFASS